MKAAAPENTIEPGGNTACKGDFNFLKHFCNLIKNFFQFSDCLNSHFLYIYI